MGLGLAGLRGRGVGRSDLGSKDAGAATGPSMKPLRPVCPFGNNCRKHPLTNPNHAEAKPTKPNNHSMKIDQATTPDEPLAAGQLAAINAGRVRLWGGRTLERAGRGKPTGKNHSSGGAGTSKPASADTCDENGSDSDETQQILWFLWGRSR